jgi:hypothetical protein
MAMESPCLLAGPRRHVSRETGPRKRRIDPLAISARQHRPSQKHCGHPDGIEKRAGKFPKILVTRHAVTIWQEIKGYQMVNFTGGFEHE